MTISAKRVKKARKFEHVTHFMKLAHGRFCLIMAFNYSTSTKYSNSDCRPYHTAKILISNFCKFEKTRKDIVKVSCNLSLNDYSS